MQITREVPPPFCIQVEPTEGCSLSCSFCGLQAIRDNGADASLGVHGKSNSAPYKFMTIATLDKVASQAAALGWNPRFEYAMHGEPSMHPKLAELISTVRKYNPKWYLMMTSNGSGFLKDTGRKIDALFDAGLNTLGLDDYKHAGGWVDKIVKTLDEYYDPDINPAPYTFHRYPAEPAGNLHHRSNKSRLVVVNDISDNSTGNHQLTNQGGNSFTAEAVSIDARCAKPFRELSIRWDGNVSICCDDWKGEYKIGNVHDTPLEDIWYHPRMEAARRRLYDGDRNFGSCQGCNVQTKRNGLLPDKQGKASMPAPDAESESHIKAALRGKVFSIKPVRATA